jgi:hypothetical protein
MRKIILGLLLSTIYGCGSSTSPKSTNPSSSETSGCPDKPKNSLEEKSVKPVSFNNGSIRESGQINSGKQVGFSFDAKKGQKIKYASNEVCVWIYAPNSNLITGDTLPIDGKYIVQVATVKGATSFALNLELRNANFITDDITTSASPSNPSSSSTASQDDVENTGRPAPDAAIIDHYRLIQSKQLDASWTDLSASFQGANIEKGLREYKEWWNSVEEIQIGGVEILDRQSNTAVAKIDLSYRIRGGRIMHDSKKYIYLLWGNDKWLINDKKDSHRK